MCEEYVMITVLNISHSVYAAGAVEVRLQAHLQLMVLSSGDGLIPSSICAGSSGALVLQLLLHSLQISHSLVLGCSSISSLLLQILNILLGLHQPLPVLLQTALSYYPCSMI